MPAFSITERTSSGTGDPSKLVVARRSAMTSRIGRSLPLSVIFAPLGSLSIVSFDKHAILHHMPPKADDHGFGCQRIGLKSRKEQGDFGHVLDHGELLVPSLPKQVC